MDTIRDPEVIRAELDPLSLRVGRLEHELEAAVNPVIRRAVELASQVDPNWYKVCAWEHNATERRGGQLVPVGAPDLQVFMNGPARGDVVLTDQVRHLWTPELLQEVEAARSRREYGFHFVNPDHRWVLKVGGVVFNLDNCDTAYLSAMNPDGSFVMRATEEYIGEWTYTVEQLDDHSPNEDHWVVGVSYVPFRLERSVFGHRVFQSVEEFVAVQRKWHADSAGR